MQNEAYMVRGHQGASPRESVEAFLSLSEAERTALQAIASGRIGTVSIALLGRLKALELIHHDGRGIILSKQGQAIAAFC